MIKIDPQHIATVASAARPEDLHAVVQGAIQLEFSTIPPYLTAMMSLTVDENRVIWSILHSIVIEEMLHMAIMCNVLNALGGAPVVDSDDFLLQYPSALPMSIDSTLVVGLEPLSIELVKNVFMAIEQPDQPLVFKAQLLSPSYKTIGDFYRALKGKLLDLGDQAFEARNQLTAPNWYAGTELFPIESARDAARAVELIVEQGEGAVNSPLAEGAELAHYYRFQQIVKQHFLIADGAGSFAFKGEPIAFNPEGVRPITRNQRLRHIDPNTQGYVRASQFAYTFSKLLRALHRAVNGEPESFSAAMSLMFELKLNGQRLCEEPVLRSGKPTQHTYGPCFERVMQEGA